MGNGMNTSSIMVYCEFIAILSTASFHTILCILNPLSLRCLAKRRSSYALNLSRPRIIGCTIMDSGDSHHRANY